MNSRIRTGVIAAAVAGGSILGLGQIGTVSAQVDDTDDATAETDAPAEQPERQRGQKLEPLAEFLGMDVEALREALQGGATLAEVATSQGVDVDALIDELVAARTERIQAGVENGRLTQEEADERIAGLEERVTTKVNEPRPERGPRGARGGPGERLGSMAEVLGMETDELAQSLRSGSTLADVAAEQGVSTDVLVDVIISDATERIENGVENGRLTQEQADERLAEIDERATQIVEEGRPPRGERPGPGGRGGPGGGPGGGQPPADAPADA